MWIDADSVYNVVMWTNVHGYNSERLESSVLRKSDFTVNWRRYVNECNHHRLIPYIRALYNNGDYIFYPDLGINY